MKYLKTIELDNKMKTIDIYIGMIKLSFFFFFNIEDNTWFKLFTFLQY